MTKRALFKHHMFPPSAELLTLPSPNGAFHLPPSASWTKTLHRTRVHSTDSSGATQRFSEGNHSLQAGSGGPYFSSPLAQSQQKHLQQHVSAEASHVRPPQMCFSLLFFFNTKSIHCVCSTKVFDVLKMRVCWSPWDKFWFDGPARAACDL